MAARRMVVGDDTDEEWAAAAFQAAERLYRTADRLGYFVSATAIISLIGLAVLVATTHDNSRGVIIWTGLGSTALFWLLGSLLARAGEAYATDLMRRSIRP